MAGQGAADLVEASLQLGHGGAHGGAQLVQLHRECVRSLLGSEGHLLLRRECGPTVGQCGAGVTPLHDGLAEGGQVAPDAVQGAVDAAHALLEGVELGAGPRHPVLGGEPVHVSLVRRRSCACLMGGVLGLAVLAFRARLVGGPLPDDGARPQQ